MPRAVFLMAYLGIALGKVPGLALGRVGSAMLGAIAMVSLGVLTIREAVQSIDLPTILLLYALMVVSAQLRLGGASPGMGVPNQGPSPKRRSRQTNNALSVTWLSGNGATILDLERGDR